MVRRTTCLKLTWAGRIVLLAIVAASIIVFARTIYPFLAVTDRVAAQTLVVDGWLPDDDLRAALDEFDTGGYELLVTAGGPLTSGRDWYDVASYAENAARILVGMGADKDRVVAAPAADVAKDRTYQSALAVKRWLERNDRPLSVNVFTSSAHARRTRLVYRMAVGEEGRVGVIASTPLEYDPQRWWRSSAGVRSMIGELIAFVYARFFFYPVEG